RAGGLAAEHPLSLYLSGRALPGIPPVCRRSLGTWRPGIASADAAHGPDWRDPCVAGLRAALVRILGRAHLCPVVFGFRTGEHWRDKKTRRAGCGSAGLPDWFESLPSVCGRRCEGG